MHWLVEFTYLPNSGLQTVHFDCPHYKQSKEQELHTPLFLNYEPEQFSEGARHLPVSLSYVRVGLQV